VKPVEPGMIKAHVVGLMEFIGKLREIISKLSTPVIHVEGDSVREDYMGFYNALRELGVRYIPVASGPGKEGWVSLDLLDPFHEVKGGEARVFDSVIDLVSGNLPTPLVKLRSLSRSGVRVWAKLEWYHPFSLSIKDRAAWYMLSRLLDEGVKPGRLYEASSTNTGTALVGLGNYYGFKTRIYPPSTAQRCVDYVSQAMGAEVKRENTPITIGLLSRVLLEASRDNAVVLNQFETTTTSQPM